MIIAVDFDDTIQIRKEPNMSLIRWLRQMQSQGAMIILWTCREEKRLQEAVQFCREHGLMPNYINRNPPEVIRRFGYDPRKIYADIYIDDKNMKKHPFGCFFHGNSCLKRGNDARQISAMKGA